MKQQLREYFQMFQDGQLTWKDKNYVSEFGVLVGLIVSPIAIVFYLFSLLLKPIAKWLMKG